MFYVIKICIIYWFGDLVGDRSLIGFKEVNYKSIEENVFGNWRKGDFCYVVVESFIKLLFVEMWKLFDEWMGLFKTIFR